MRSTSQHFRMLSFSVCISGILRVGKDSCSEPSYSDSSPSYSMLFGFSPHGLYLIWCREWRLLKWRLLRLLDCTVLRSMSRSCEAIGERHRIVLWHWISFINTQPSALASRLSSGCVWCLVSHIYGETKLGDQRWSVWSCLDSSDISWHSVLTRAHHFERESNSSTIISLCIRDFANRRSGVFSSS